jgi:hypothetical protein
VAERYASVSYDPAAICFPPCVRFRCANGTYKSPALNHDSITQTSSRLTGRGRNPHRSCSFGFHTNLKAVCRAVGRDEHSRYAVRMTAQGSVTPGMACGSRPVKRIPEHGAFPTVGINPGPGLPRGRPFPPWPAPANGRLANRPSRPGRNRPRRIRQTAARLSCIRQTAVRPIRIRLRAESPSIQSPLVDAKSTLNPWPQMIHLLRQQTGWQARELRIHLHAAVPIQ